MSSTAANQNSGLSAKSLLFSYRRIPLREFPGLFAMEGHTGGCGIAFTAIWYFCVWIFDRSVLNTELVSCGIVIAVLFFALMWLALPFANGAQLSLERINQEDDPDAKNALQRAAELRVRRRIAFLSASYAIVCSALIFVTGGATSPFAAFYIMIFTLTITKNKTPHPGFAIMGYFILCIWIACAARGKVAWPLTDADMETIYKAPFHAWLHALFIGASMVVPTVSKYLVERKEEETHHKRVAQS